MGDISNTEDYLDVREIIDRVEELEDSCKPWRAKLGDFAGTDEEDTFATHEEARDALAEWLTDREFADSAAEVQALKDGEASEFVVGENGLTAAIEAVEVDEDDADEFRVLTALLDEMTGTGGDHKWRGDWYPVTLIRETAFVEYTEEFVQDCYGMPDDLPSFVAIDWQKTADNIRIDFFEVEFDGVTYLYR